MADDLHYVPGDFYRIDDRTGFKVRASRTRKEWTGLIVDVARWEARQPQDFVTGVRDDQSVPQPRPRQVNVFLGPLITSLTANASAGASSLAVLSSVRMQIGDSITIILFDGSTFNTNISSVPTPTSIVINPTLPQAAIIGGEIVDNSAVATANIG